MGSQQFCLKWKSHYSNLLSALDQLLFSESFTDVTLACEGLSLKAHKAVLAACSPFFQVSRREQQQQPLEYKDMVLPKSILPLVPTGYSNWIPTSVLLAYVELTGRQAALQLVTLGPWRKVLLCTAAATFLFCRPVQQKPIFAS